MTIKPVKSYKKTLVDSEEMYILSVYNCGWNDALEELRTILWKYIWNNGDAILHKSFNELLNTLKK